MPPSRVASLFAVARGHWRSFAPVWTFPLVFLFGGIVAELLEHSTLFFWTIAAPLFFWSLWRACGPWRRGEIGYWPTMLWAVFVPFLIWLSAVFLQLLALRALGIRVEI